MCRWCDQHIASPSLSSDQKIPQNVVVDGAGVRRRRRFAAATRSLPNQIHALLYPRIIHRRLLRAHLRPF